jgi:hypothetical protein
VILIEWFLVGLAWIWSLIALGAVVLLILSYRDPRPKEPAVPDYVPDDWGGGGHEVRDTKRTLPK